MFVDCLSLCFENMVGKKAHKPTTTTKTQWQSFHQ
jgi:hypothetical protein